MSSISILSINVGLPKPMTYRDQSISTGIGKTPVSGSLYLSETNFDGDRQADPVNHGGPDKAVCVYPFEHYDFWERELRRTLPYGAFGENLTVSGLAEDNVCIGDIFRLGEAVVQVSQPRQPCFKLAALYDRADLPVLVQDTGFTGFYFRVLRPGIVQASDGLTRISSHPKSVTVAFANRIKHHDKRNIEAIRAILEVDALSANWRASFLKRLEGIEPNDAERLRGER